LLDSLLQEKIFEKFKNLCLEKNGIMNVTD